MRRLLILAVLLMATTTISAAPIGEYRARQIAEEFFAMHATRSTQDLNLEWAGTTLSATSTKSYNVDDALMYIYTRGDKGFVIISGDDNSRPIIAYSLDATFDITNMATATRRLLDAWCCEIADSREGYAMPPATRNDSATRDNELLYTTAQWGQTEPFNLEAPIINGEHAATGCVVTAMAIICHYNRWPERGVGTTPEYYYEDMVEGMSHVIEANTLGRSYDYDNMLLSYEEGYTPIEAAAVAALMKDMGTSVEMKYHNEGSGAYDDEVIKALTTYFGYSKESMLALGAGYSTEEWSTLLRENLRDYGPTYFSGIGVEGGHAFVLDGYDAHGYFHINFGWNGRSNGYYLLPSIDFYEGQMALLSLSPDMDGTSDYRDNILLYAMQSINGEWAYRGILSNATKYIEGAAQDFTIGCFMNYGTREFNGDVALVHCSKDGTWKEVLYTYHIANMGITSSHIYPYYETITINTTIDEGDRLRLYYKSDDRQEWQWARRMNEDAVNEVILRATPEEVAESLMLQYNREEGCLYLQSPHCLQISINQSNEECYSSHTPIRIESLTKGNNTLEIASGGRPYTLKIKL